MTTYSITLRCRKNRAHEPVHRDYRIEAWTREDAIRKAKDLALQQGFTSTVVHWCMPSFIVETSK